MGNARIALVTGAGRRLGYTVCQALLVRGYHVVALYRSRTADLGQLEAAGAHTLAVDLAQPASVAAALAAVVRDYPRLDLLVNNASEFVADPDDGDDLAALAQRLFQINAIAPMTLMAGLSEPLRAPARNGDGHSGLIVNITDIFVDKPDPAFASYCASKAALSNLTLGYARKLAPEVRVNAIMPGPIQFLPEHTPAQREKVMAQTLLPREGGFDSVVTQLLALVDNDFITGALIPVDGGRRLA